MAEESNRGLWAGLIIAGMVAVVFAILWFLRGGDVTKLTADLGSSQSAMLRLEGELREARSQVDSSTRRVGELENQLREEARRASDAAATLERRLQGEISLSNQRLAAANAQLDRLRAENETATGGEADRIREELEQTRRDLAAIRQTGEAEVQRLNDELASARSLVTSLENRLATEGRAVARAESDLREASPALRATAGDSAPAARTEIESLKTELAKTAQSLAEARNANAVLEEVRGRLHAAMEEEKTEAAAREQELVQAIEQLRQARPGTGVSTAGSVQGSEPEKMPADGREPATGDQTAPSSEAAAAEWQARLRAKDEEIARLAERASQAERALQAQVSALRSELDGAKERHSQVAAAADSAWRSRLAAADQEAVIKLAETEKKAAETIEQLRARVEESERELKAARARVEEQRDSARKEAEERVAAANRASEAKLAEWQKLSADRIAKMEEEAKDAAARFNLLQNSYMKQNERYNDLSTRYDKETQELRARIEELEKAVAEYGPNGRKFGLTPNGRSVGKIIDRIADGPIVVIDGGTRQGVRPGMKFDVYRPIDEGNRYVGMIKVIRVLSDSSMAVSTYGEVTSMVCPVTGRVVLEPGAKFSPFVAGRDGGPLPLERSDTVGVPLEAPAIGDLLDNPFHEPESKTSFRLAPELADDECALFTVEALGGVTVSPASATSDFLVVAYPYYDGPGPRQVILEHLQRYLDPAMLP